MYILDANTLICYFKGMGQVEKKLLAVAPKDICIPAVVVFELEYRILKSNAPKKRQAQLQALCDVVEIVPFAEEEARCAARVRAQLEKKGTLIGAISGMNILIAGTALARQAVLVTNNNKEFARVAKLEIDNWFV